MNLTEKDKERLKGVHPSLVNLITLAAKNPPIPFMVIEGVRADKRQQELYKLKKSKCDGVKNKSNHQVQKDGFGHAFDAAPLEKNKTIDWNNSAHFKLLSDHFKKCASILKIKINWGGDFKSFHDAPHYELA